MEIDSFIGWLLVFYIAFFYLVDFSVEKNIGIKGDFVFRTLKTPLILDITIFLLIMHTILKIKNSFFRKNILAAIFLTFFGFGLFALIIINF